MPHVPGVRSCYAKVGRLVYFGRMLDKLRLHAAGRLPADYVANLGDEKFLTLDGRCCRFLGVRYAELRDRALAGGTDEELLAWAHARGTPRTDEECHVWNRFLLKLGWRDERSAVLPQRILDAGLSGKPIETVIDHIEFDEGRDPVATRAWDTVLVRTHAPGRAAYPLAMPGRIWDIPRRTDVTFAAQRTGHSARSPSPPDRPHL